MLGTYFECLHSAYGIFLVVIIVGGGVVVVVITAVYFHHSRTCVELYVYVYEESTHMSAISFVCVVDLIVIYVVNLVPLAINSGLF